ncbi:unnamed protein product [Rotaria socialis]|uniref:Uncharacterized protein n=1 Tax=Rotaria socialis TaxID=392032 RepID=A0A817XC89_9BILA|nr:unnamed protein product [Rotaria socialis]CAF4412357.1 unnamed protein product [Rotaria socialis]
MKQLVLTVLLFFTTVHCQATTSSIVQTKLIPFGVIQGDAVLERGDDQISSSIRIPIRFPFFNGKYDEIKIQINGMILFGNQSYQSVSYTPRRFPVDEIVCVAPFWADVLTRNDLLSNIFYRQITDQATLSELDRIVANAFPAQATHRFIWAYVVTWYEVPGYGLSANFRNTFQAIITTNGINSFAIYNYDKLQWTVGSASSSVHAQAGFNAGDLKNYFLINKSFTPQIVQIVGDSNVQFPGRFIFSIGGDINDVECNTPDGLQVAPFRGSPDGGYEIRLYGICFNETNYIVKLDQQILTGCIITPTYITCMVPMVYNGPTLQIQVSTIRNELIATTDFFVDIPEDNSELLIQSSNTYDSFIEMGQNDSIILQFKKDFVTNNNMFTIELHYYDTIFTENYELVSIVPRQRVLYQSVNLSSLATLTIRYRDIFELAKTQDNMGDLQVQLLKLTFKIISMSTVIPMPLAWLYRAVTWTAIAVKQTRTFCAKWEAQLPQLPPPSTYQSQVPQCPCRVPATGQNRFPLTFNNFQTDSFCNAHKQNTCQSNTGASHCYRRSFNPTGPGVKCCYNTNGMIISRPESGGGGLELQANSGGSIIQRIKHVVFDQWLSWACCKLPQMITQIRPESCNKFHQQRPSFECENVPLPVPSGGNGDPHFTTLDGIDYTFNGYGEYVLLRTHTLPISTSLEIQIRTKSVKSDSEDNQATAIVAFVIKNGNYSKVQFELFDQLKLLELRLNNHTLDSDVFLRPSNNDDYNSEIYQMLMAMSRTIHFDNNQMSITQTNRTIFKITYSNNVQLIIKIREQYDFLNIVTILPKLYEGHCQGLLGNMDGDKTNDFIFQDGQTILSSTEQQSEERQFIFGQSWRVTPETTLFAYIAGENYHAQQNLHYRPIFREELVQRFQNTTRLERAKQNCQKIVASKANEQCVYDILVTNDQTMSELHQDFQTNLNEWKEYAELVQNDHVINMGMQLAFNGKMIFYTIIMVSAIIFMY